VCPELPEIVVRVENGMQQSFLPQDAVALLSSGSVLSRNERKHAASTLTIFFDSVVIVQQELLLQATRLISRLYGVEVASPAKRYGGQRKQDWLSRHNGPAHAALSALEF